MTDWAAMAQAFCGPEHRSAWFAGDRQAAVFVHGLPGTPAELRPLAEALHRAGWTVRAPLLPGFGEDMESLTGRSRHEWVAAVCAEWRQLAEYHMPRLLVGYGMGAAIALLAAAKEHVPAMALLGPPMRMNPGGLGWAWPLLRRWPKPIRALHWEDPALRRLVSDVSLPNALHDEFVQLGREAMEAAGHYLGPTLLAQPFQDHFREKTMPLLSALGGPVTYMEIEGGHDMVLPDHPGHEAVQTALARFAWDAWEPLAGLHLPQFG